LQIEASLTKLRGDVLVGFGDEFAFRHLPNRLERNNKDRNLRLLRLLVSLGQKIINIICPRVGSCERQSR
jgi:hypothetical protein